MNLTCQWLSPLFTLDTHTCIILQWARIQANHCLTTCKSLTKASEKWPWESKMWGLLAQKTSFEVLFFNISAPYPSLRKKLPNSLYGGRIIICIIHWFEHLLYSTPLSPCSQGSNPGINTIWGLGLFLVLSLAMRGFSWVLRFFLLLKNQHFQIPVRRRMHGHI